MTHRCLELLVSAVESVYEEDEGKPSVLVTKITPTTWYASVGRYPKAGVGQDSRKTVCAAKAQTAELALMLCAREWLKALVTSQVSDLAKHVGLYNLPEPKEDQRKISFEEDEEGD